jgi:hypothetical protein
MVEQPALLRTLIAIAITRTELLLPFTVRRHAFSQSRQPRPPPADSSLDSASIPVSLPSGRPLQGTRTMT